jgi:hypothetical protein
MLYSPHADVSKNAKGGFEMEETGKRRGALPFLMFSASSEFRLGWGPRPRDTKLSIAIHVLCLHIHGCT